jgi:hypothetical protein
LHEKRGNAEGGQPSAGVWNVPPFLLLCAPSATAHCEYEV